MANADEIRRHMPFYSPITSKPKLPANLVALEARCPDDAHLAEGNCCYYRVLVDGGYGELAAEREVANLQELQDRVRVRPEPKPQKDVSDQEGESAIDAWMRRRKRRDIGRENLVNEDERLLEPEPDGMYLVIGGERVRIDG